MATSSKGKFTLFQFRIEKELLEQVDQRAKASNRSTAGQMRELVKTSIAK